MASSSKTPSGTSGLWDPNYFDEGVRIHATKALSKLRSMYNAGSPFFTRQSIREIYQQLRELRDKVKKISVTGLDGVVVDFDVRTGSTVEADDPELEFLLQAPIIHYLPGPWLIDPFYASLQPQLIYCSLRITHRGTLYNKFTKELARSGSIRPYEKVQKSFQDCLEAWKSSGSWQQLSSSLARARTTPSSIIKIIGFACGSISTPADQCLAERSLFQHALLLSLQHLLNDGISCYAQDPAYSDIDKMVLAKSGIVVLDDPKAFLEVDDSTLVFSCAPDIPIRQVVSDLTCPAIMIWDNVTREENTFSGEFVMSADPVSPRLQEMIQTMYDELEFPEDKQFGDLAVYIRRPATMSTDKRRPQRIK